LRHKEILGAIDNKFDKLNVKCKKVENGLQVFVTGQPGMEIHSLASYLS
jgi:hypothetical protein